MTESATTATIRAWHTHMEQGAPDWYDLAGELLDRLEKAETTIENIILAFEHQNVRRPSLTLRKIKALIGIK